MPKQTGQLGKTKYLKRMSNRSGLTFLELLFAAGTLLITILGIIQGFLYFYVAAQSAESTLRVVVETQDIVEQIRNADYNTIYSTYDSANFSLGGMNGVAVVSVNNTNPELLGIKVVSSWQSGNERIKGEDVNLNGVLDGGEDTNGDGVLSSPVEIETLVTR